MRSEFSSPGRAQKKRKRRRARREGARLLKPVDGLGGGVAALLGAEEGGEWYWRPKIRRWGCGQVGPFPTANASPDIARWRGRALDVGRGAPAVCGCAEGDKGDTTFLLSTSVAVYCHAGLLSRCKIVFTSFINYSEPVLPFQTTTDTPLLLRSQQ